ncbi:MAG: pyridoxal phosphate-dependent aminotransferase [Candidatus Asgardarchaeum californiense]|nr:MAG: pyridoxal phosphate-dependent aminotransferase [Candidatus Asgardarchaeum californiense]
MEVYVMKKLSDAVMRVPPSGTMTILDAAKALERKGVSVIHLDVGEPHFDTPPEIKDAAIKALENGYTKYTPSRGILELRRAIISEYNSKYNLELSAEKNIIITPGAKFSVYAAILSILGFSEHAIILTPTWVSYWAPMAFVNAQIREVNVMLGSDNFEEKLKESVNRDTKLLIYNSPNNPTGKILSKNELKVIRDLCLDYDFFIIADEIYNFLTYDNRDFISILEFKEIQDRTVVINGFSKKYAMTGWRLGYAVASSFIIDQMVKIQQAATTCPTSFIQFGALAAFNNREKVEHYVNMMKKAYQENRDLVISLLSEIEGVMYYPPEGAFYIFPDISAYTTDSKKFVMKLLEEKHVSTTPGSVFGAGGEGHIRISFATTKEKLKMGLHKIKELINE